MTNGSAGDGREAATSGPDDGAHFDVFISYASENKRDAFSVCEILEAKGLTCWIAPRDVRAGHEYPTEIVRGIGRSKFLVLLLSKASNASVFVQREVERATSYGKPIFPFRLENVLPAPQIELFVSSRQWIDAWSGSLDASVEALAGAIAAFREGGSQPIRPPAGVAVRALRFAARNLQSVIALGALGVAMAAVALFLLRPAPPPGETVAPKTELSELSKDDFVVETQLYELSDELNYQFSVSLARSDAWEIASGLTYAYSIDGGPFVSRRALRREQVTGRPPKQVTLKVSDQDGDTIGPFSYDLDFEQLLEEKVAKIVETGGWLRCRGVHYGGATRCSINLPEAAATLMGAIRVGAAPDKLVYSLDPASPSESPGLVYYPPERGKKNAEFLIPLVHRALFAQLVHRDGRESAVQNVVEQRQTDGVMLGFNVPAETDDAPLLFAVLMRVKSQSGRGGYWSVFPMIDIEASAEWSIHEGGWTPVERKFEKVAVISSKSGAELGAGEALDGKAAPALKLRVTGQDGTQTVYSYRPDWTAWLATGLRKDVKFDQIVKCGKGSAKYYGEQIIGADCRLSSEGRVWKTLIADIHWGLSPDKLESVDRFSGDALIKRLETVLVKHAQEAARKRGEAPGDGLKGRYADTLSSFRRSFERDHKDWREEQGVSGGLVAVAEPVDAVYFRFVLKSGETSDVIRAPVR